MTDKIKAVLAHVVDAWDAYLAFVSAHPKTVSIALVVLAVLAIF